MLVLIALCVLSAPRRSCRTSRFGAVDRNCKTAPLSCGCRYLLLFSSYLRHDPVRHGRWQLHINLGLDKLRETQAGVEDMQKGLAEKERRLRFATPCALHDFFFVFSRRAALLDRVNLNARDSP